ncbi:hypothetical protein HX017_02950 [Myroides marinus]|uniref:hypothetical protein n=1 Tax=Myroides marinus TaxID=703342 RepID=UPI002577AF51|nr:hypothetical protein [Myroides marinus]MDM1346028.1 hypothetical protein [Myroides marinus]MDM1353282.1 hypothetical protein [Myroides marinus]MDM1363908.1 hypothetical protein [Myroides marinus]
MKKLFCIIILLLSGATFAQSYRMTSDTREQIAKVSYKALVFFTKIEEVLDCNVEKLLAKQTDIQNPAIGEVVKQGVKYLGDENQYKVKKLICISCYEAEWDKQMIEAELIKQGTAYDRNRLYSIEEGKIDNMINEARRMEQ